MNAIVCTSLGSDRETTCPAGTMFGAGSPSIPVRLRTKCDVAPHTTTRRPGFRFASHARFSPITESRRFMTLAGGNVPGLA